MRTSRLVWILAVLAIVAAPMAFAGEGCGNHATAAATDTAAKPACCAGAEGATCTAGLAQKALDLATRAEGGCSASMDALIATAKSSGHEDIVALATKAEGGCEASRAALVAKVKEMHGEAPAVQTASMTQLAEWAEGGCAKSAANLIAMAKKSDDKKMAELATKAEGGCEHSKSALIAMAKGE